MGAALIIIGTLVIVVGIVLLFFAPLAGIGSIVNGLICADLGNIYDDVKEIKEKLNK